MVDSILGSVTQLLDIEMDVVLLGQVNSAFDSLARIGVGPVAGFSVVDDSAKWSEFLPPGPRLNDAKTYVLFSIVLQRDPPTMMSVHCALRERVQEAFQRLKMRR